MLFVLLASQTLTYIFCDIIQVKLLRKINPKIYRKLKRKDAPKNKEYNIKIIHKMTRNDPHQ